MRTKKPRKAPLGGRRVCEICERGEDVITRWIMHHVSYEPEVLANLCYACHSRLHGTARIFNHPFEKLHGRDTGPFVFACAVVELYASKMAGEGRAEDEDGKKSVGRKSKKGGENGKR